MVRLATSLVLLHRPCRRALALPQRWKKAFSTVPAAAPADQLHPWSQWGGAHSPALVTQQTQLGRPSLEDLGALVEQVKGEAPPAAAEWMTETLDTLQREQQDMAALLKRSWSDEAYEDGEVGNEQKIEGFELELVEMLQRTNIGLADGVVLGNAIDLAGAYKKNYKLDRAEAVLLRCTRNAELRSGAWMVKYLNHISQVRMKQRRDLEALEMMYEIESLATFTVDEPGGSMFYETLYRNMSCALRSLGKEEEAAVYFMKMADASKRHKASLEWMDLWDLGRLVANKAYQTGRWQEFYKARATLEDALRLQDEVEPHEHVLRAKLLSNLGQCYLATDEHEEAEKHYSEAYRLFRDTVGKRSPLFGMQAWACGNLRCAEGRWAEALPYLGEGLYVEVVGDGLSVSEMLKLHDQILQCLHEAGGSEGADLEPVKRSLRELSEDPRWHALPETEELAVLAHKAALVHLTCRWTDGGTAAEYSSRAVRVLQALPREGRVDQWLMQAEVVHRTLAGKA